MQHITRFLLRMLLPCVAIATSWVQAMPQMQIDYRISLTANAGSGDFAPYYMMSNVHGTLTQPYSTLLRASAEKKMDTSQRFSYGFGLDVIGGYSSKTEYARYDQPTDTWNANKQGPSPVWLQQLYAEVKYRCLFISAGLKERGSVLVNDILSSGDMAYSANARPIPGVRLGFVDFQDIPLTRGWVQIRGELSYGYSSTPAKWLENHYNYYSSFINTKEWYCYKYVHFRTNPDKPFSFLIGMQSTCQFGGVFHQYFNGVEYEKNYKDMTPDVGAFFKAIIPMAGNSNFYEGNHLGTWDVMGRYRFANGSELKAYYQSPWEDGSGIGKLNGFDGLWGIEYKGHKFKYIDNAVFEYYQSTHQSGPLHGLDFDDMALKTGGADDYYNNFFYTGWEHWGYSLGTPLSVSPVYNDNGSLRFYYNRVRAFHVAFSGDLSDEVSYVGRFNHSRTWGTPYMPIPDVKKSVSAAIEIDYSPAGLKSWHFRFGVGGDVSDVYGDNIGLSVAVRKCFDIVK